MNKDQFEENISEFISQVVLKQDTKKTVNHLKEIENAIINNPELEGLFVEQLNNPSIRMFLLEHSTLPRIKTICEEHNNKFNTENTFIFMTKGILEARLNALTQGLGFEEENAFIFKEDEHILDFLQREIKDENLLELLENTLDIEKLIEQPIENLTDSQRQLVETLSKWFDKNMYILAKTDNGILSPRPVSGDLISLDSSNNKQTRMLNKNNRQKNSVNYNIKYLNNNDAKNALTKNNNFLSQTNSAFISMQEINKNKLILDNTAQQFLNRAKKNILLISLKNGLNNRKNQEFSFNQIKTSDTKNANNVAERIRKNMSFH